MQQCLDSVSKQTGSGFVRNMEVSNPALGQEEKLVLPLTYRDFIGLLGKNNVVKIEAALNLVKPYLRTDITIDDVKALRGNLVRLRAVLNKKFHGCKRNLKWFQEREEKFLNIKLSVPIELKKNSTTKTISTGLNPRSANPASIHFQSTCANCSVPLPVNKFVADYTVPPELETRSVHQVIELIFTGKEPVQALPNTLKFCESCGSIFGKILTSYMEFLRGTAIGSYIDTFRNGLNADPEPDCTEFAASEELLASSGRPLPSHQELTPAASGTRKSSRLSTREAVGNAEKMKRRKMNSDPLATLTTLITVPGIMHTASGDTVEIKTEGFEAMENKNEDELFGDALWMPPVPLPPPPGMQEKRPNPSSRGKKRTKCSISNEKLPADITTAHGGRPYSCPECKQAFRTRNGLDIHTRRIHRNRGQGKKIKPGKKVHLEHSEESLLTYTDYKCDNSSCSAAGIPFIEFSEFGDWVQHQESAHNLMTGYQTEDGNDALKPVDGLIRPCPQCGKQLKSNAEMLSHIKEVHVDPRPYPCDVCDEKFQGKYEVAKHKGLVHNGVSERNFRCTLCEATFKYSYNLELHERTHYGLVTKNLECHVCSAKFYTATALRQHSTGHLDTSERSFPCDQCGKAFQSQQHLNTHKFRQHVKKFIIDQICEFCGKGYAFKDKLKDHLMSVHKLGKEAARTSCKMKRGSLLRILPNGDRVFNEKPTKPKTCNICQRTYARREQLFTHMMSVHDKTEAEAREFTGLETKRVLVKKGVPEENDTGND